jgi:hypothetical protein
MMADLKGLAQRESQSFPAPTLDDLTSRIGIIAQPYANELGIDPVIAAQLIGYIARIAAGIIREQQIAHLRAETVIIRDER